MGNRFATIEFTGRERDELERAIENNFQSNDQVLAAFDVAAIQRLVAYRRAIREGIFNRTMSTEDFGLKVTVTQVETIDNLDFISLSCNHFVTYDHDEANATLVGAETTCERGHK